MSFNYMRINVMSRCLSATDAALLRTLLALAVSTHVLEALMVAKSG